MDPSTIIGILIAFGSLFAMIQLEGASVTSLLLPAPMILVFGATIAVGLAGTTLRDAMAAFRDIPRALIGRRPDPTALVAQLVGIAETARREGLLALEDEAQQAKDPLVRTALQNIADGTDGDELRYLLEDAIATRSAVFTRSGAFFKSLGGYAPTVGIIGTVVSLTHVLEQLSDPEKLGHSIAAAFVATLWGLLSANFMWLPLGDRLTRLAQLEIDAMTMTLEGMLAIQSGASPRLLQERLQAMSPSPVRTSMPIAEAKGEEVLV